MTVICSTRRTMSELKIPIPEEEPGHLPMTSDNKHSTDESLKPLMGFRLKPRFDEKINAESIKQIIRDVHNTILEGKIWDDLNPKITINTISDTIKNTVKNNYRSNRYKFIVQTIINKFSSQMVSLKVRCIWDVKTDRLVYENYHSEYIICSTVVISIFFY